MRKLLVFGLISLFFFSSIALSIEASRTQLKSLKLLNLRDQTIVPKFSANIRIINEVAHPYFVKIYKKDNIGSFVFLDNLDGNNSHVITVHDQINYGIQLWTPYVQGQTSVQLSDEIIIPQPALNSLTTYTIPDNFSSLKQNWTLSWTISGQQLGPHVAFVIFEIDQNGNPIGTSFKGGTIENAPGVTSTAPNDRVTLGSWYEARVFLMDHDPESWATGHFDWDDFNGHAWGVTRFNPTTTPVEIHVNILPTNIFQNP